MGLSPVWRLRKRKRPGSEIEEAVRGGPALSAKIVRAGPVTAEKAAPLLAPHKAAGAELGREAACPVTGKKFTVAESTPALDLKGKTYYFSDELSLEKFKKNPGKYLGVLEDRAKSLLKKKKG